MALLIPAAAPSTVAAATIKVSNLRGRQLADGTVEVLYDLSNVSASGAVVAVRFSTGGGAYDIIPSDSALSGDVGPGISNGTNHRIVWNASATLQEEFSSTTMRAAVIAQDPTGGGGGILAIAPGITITMVRIPAGTFSMGSPSNERYRGGNEDLHLVTLTHDYFMSTQEVTQAQWQAVMGSAMPTSCGNAGVGPDEPVYCVSWDDICGGATGSSCPASSFIGRLNAMTGTAAFRLPTEAEWERAARAGSQAPFSFGDDSACAVDDCSFCTLFDRHMVWCGNGSGSTRPVGSKSPNSYGLYDMHGNVWEWVADLYSDHLGTAAVTDPSGPSSGSSRVWRGGGYSSVAGACRSASRIDDSPSSRLAFRGFRVASGPLALHGTGYSDQFTLNVQPQDPPIEEAGPFTYLVPASAHVSGLGGTSWVSDVVIFNGANSPAYVNLYYLPGNQDHRGRTGKQVFVPVRASVTLADVLGTTFGQSSGSGSLYLGSDRSLVVTSRTYNNAPSGTYGQFIAGRPTGTAIQANQVAHLIQLTRSGDYRTNIGFANASGTAITVSVDLYGSDGSLIAARSYPLEPWGFYQKTDPIGTNVSDAYALVSSSTAGARFFTYASVIDNRTGDPVCITPEAGTASASHRLYIPGSAHVNGAGGTHWRTDVEIQNPGASTARYTVELLRRDQQNSSPQSVSYTLAGGHAVRYADALSTWFGFTGAAALRITPSSGTIKVTSRTYNATSSGTFGQFIPAVPDSVAIAAGTSVPLVQLSDSASTTTGYRSNIGFVNTSALTIDVTAELYDGLGYHLGTRALTLRPSEYTQVDRVFRSVTSQTIEGGYAILTTATPGGSFLAYASVVDNRSGDPVYVPATASGN